MQIWNPKVWTQFKLIRYKTVPLPLLLSTYRATCKSCKFNYQVLEHKCHPSIHPLYPTTNAISVLMIPTKILRFAMIGIKIKYFKMNWSITIASTNNLQIERARARCKSITDEEIFSLRGCENTQVKRRFTIIQTSHF